MNPVKIFHFLLTEIPQIEYQKGIPKGRSPKSKSYGGILKGNFGRGIPEQRKPLQEIPFVAILKGRRQRQFLNGHFDVRARVIVTPKKFFSPKSFSELTQGAGLKKRSWFKLN